MKNSLSVSSERRQYTVKQIYSILLIYVGYFFPNDKITHSPFIFNLFLRQSFEEVVFKHRLYIFTFVFKLIVSI